MPILISFPGSQLPSIVARMVNEAPFTPVEYAPGSFWLDSAKSWVLHHVKAEEWSLAHQPDSERTYMALLGIRDLVACLYQVEQPFLPLPPFVPTHTIENGIELIPVMQVGLGFMSVFVDALQYHRGGFWSVAQDGGGLRNSLTRFSYPQARLHRNQP